MCFIRATANMGVMTKGNQDKLMKEIYLKDMEIQWNDHFHMRDQTWKTLQYTIAIFLGVVGLQYKDGIDPNILLIAKLALLITSLLGLAVAIHHRNRQDLKFDLINLYEEKLDLKPLIDPILDKYKSGFFNKVNTSTFICVGHAAMFCVAISMLYAHSS